MRATRSKASPAAEILSIAAWALRQAWKAHPRHVAGLTLIALSRSLVPAISALTIRELINVAVDESTTTLSPVLPWITLALALTAAEAVSSLLHTYLGRRLTDDLDLTVTSEILEHASKLDVACFEDVRFQDTLDRARQNTAGHFSQFITYCLTFLTHVGKALALICVVATIEPLAIAVLIPLALPHLIIQWRLARKHYRVVHGNATKRRWTSYFVSLLTSRQSVAEVKLFGLASHLIERFQALVSVFRDENKLRHLRGLRFDAAFAFVSTAGFYAVFAVVIRKFLQGALQIGDVVVFGTVGLQLRGALSSLTFSASQSMEHSLYISNLRSFLQTRTWVRDTGTLAPASSEGQLEFCNVSFTYPGSSTPTLRDVSFTIHPGETVAVVGRNGAGKTTLVKLIARYYDPDDGTIRFDGNDLRELSIQFLQGQLAIVPHHFGHYEATAADNIAYGAWERLRGDRESIREVVRRAGIEGLVDAMPQGLDTRLGRMFGEYDLSSGQWQQLAIARTFARDTRVLILDEPTSNLDAMAEQKLLSQFRELAQAKTTLLISHRFSTVKTADRILVMEGGRIVETGTHAELLERGGHYATLLEAQRGQWADELNSSAGAP